MRDGDTLVFVEVRQRKSNLFGGAAQSIDRRKMQKCALAAQCWLKQNRALCTHALSIRCGAADRDRKQLEARLDRNAFVFQDVF